MRRPAPDRPRRSHPYSKEMKQEDYAVSLRKEEALHFSCPHCGGSLAYGIQEGKLICRSCNQQFTMTEIADPSAEDKNSAMEVQEYRCPQCGADIHTVGEEPVNCCSFCGSDAVFTRQISRLKRPDLIVPFKITREKCEEIYKRRVKSALFAPRELLTEETTSRFQPIYIPFWKYNAVFNGPGSYQYKEKYTQGDTTYTDTYQAALDLHIRMDRAYYDASSRFDDETAMRLCMRPHDIRPFHAGYLCGCFAEGADVGQDVYKSAIAHEANEALSARLGGTAAYQGHLTYTCELTLLPVWLLANRQNGRVLYTAINGETGEIVCDTTVTTARYALLSGAFALLFFALLMLLGSAVILRARLTAGLCAMLSAAGCAALAPRVNETHSRLSGDTDPTRQRLAKTKSKKITLPPNIWNNKSPFSSYLPLIAFPAGILVYTVISRITAGNYNAFVGSFTSDQAFFPTLLMLISAVITWWLTDSVSSAPHKWLFLLLALVQSGTFVYMLMTNQRDHLFLLSAAMLALLAAAVIMQFKTHNGYVTRPVPIFGEKENRA